MLGAHHYWIVIRGSGDVGSAVAHRLFLAGHTLIIHDDSRPTTSRRGMAFTDAIFDGQAVLEGVTAMRVDEVAVLATVIAEHKALPITVINFPELLSAVRPDILIDARMRKRMVPEVQRGLAPLTIGLGPNFIAGVTTDLAVETSWGDALGAIVARGPTRPLAGEPRPIAGYGRDRFVYAPVAGIFRTAHHIGDSVVAEAVVATIGAVALHAPLDGVLRGLTRGGVPVQEGAKVIEVDPRGPMAVVRG
ncbi:MAG TPA: hypothetical protein VEZ12_17470, partial [Herpetosiphonaceae bacterium]|nr:hypothetical protein [Herpetosiphonaceae bacterium]